MTDRARDPDDIDAIVESATPVEDGDYREVEGDPEPMDGPVEEQPPKPGRRIDTPEQAREAVGAPQEPEEPPHAAEQAPTPTRAVEAVSVAPEPSQGPVAVVTHSPVATSIPNERAVAVRSSGAAAMADVLAEMSEADFERQLMSLKAGWGRLERIQRELMTEGVDYGRLPGISKPTLLKPGAEKLARFYGLVADFTPTRIVGDGVTAPALDYTVRCDLHVGDITGPIVATGYGTANSWEARYRWRNAKPSCPACGAQVLIKGRPDGRLQGKYWCPGDKGGCSNTWEPEVIERQPRGKVENADPYDLGVTLLKMAEKRANVDAVLRATATSGLFTQDVEDTGGEPERPTSPQEPAGATETAEQPRQAPRTQPSPERPSQGSQQASEARTFTVSPTDSKCPKHKKEWRANRRGWYCPSKDTQTESGWCDLKPHPQWVAQQ